MSFGDDTFSSQSFSAANVPHVSSSVFYSYWAWNLFGETSAMFKNVAGRVTLLAVDTATNLPKTGDAANITAYVKIDGGAVTQLGDTSAAEEDATNAPGLYTFTVAQAESNGDVLVFSAKSSTSSVRIVPRVITTIPSSGIASQASVDNLNDVSVGDIRIELTSELLVMTRLGTAIVLDGAVYQFTTNALENAPGGGGDTTVNVMPVSGSATIGNVLDGVRIKGQYGAPLTGLTITCTTTNAGVTSARDLTAYNGALALVVFENDDDMDHGTRIVHGSDITVASNVATISSTASHVLNTLLGENLRWCLRQDTAAPSIVFAIGDYTCQRAPVTA